MQYTESIDLVPAPYVSSMSQSSLLRLAATSYALGGDPADLELSSRILNSFQIDWTQGGVRHEWSPGVSSFEEYASRGMERPIEVLNGFLFAIGNLAKSIDLGIESLNEQLVPLYEDGLAYLDARIEDWETSFNWTYYDQTGVNRATADYHVYQTMLLTDLACRESRAKWVEVAARWWTFYTDRMPFAVVRGPSGESSGLLHLRGVYPHPYLTDEYSLTLVSDGDRLRRIETSLASQYVSGSSPYGGSWNVVEASQIEGVERVGIWFSGLLGLPSMYRAGSQEIAQASVGGPSISPAVCGLPTLLAPTAPPSKPLAAELLPAAVWSATSLLYDLPTEVSPMMPTLCVELPNGWVPVRQALPVSGEPTTSGRVGVSSARPDGSVEMVIADQSHGDYRDGESVVYFPIEALAMSPDAAIEIPITASGVASLLVNIYLDSGKVLTRTLPFEGPTSNGRGTARVFLSSFPEWEPGSMTGFAVRLLLDLENPPSVATVGPATILCDSSGLLSGVEAVLTQTGWSLTRVREVSGRIRLAVSNDPWCAALSG